MIESDILQYLSTALPGTYYLGIRPEQATLPCTTAFLISTEVIHNVVGYSGVSQARIQLDVWSTTYSDCQTIAESQRLLHCGPNHSSQ